VEIINRKNKPFEIAKQKVKKIKSFYNHLFVFIAVHFFMFMAVLTYYGNLKPLLIISVLGWGIGVFVYAIKIFHENPFLSRDWEIRKIQEFLKEQD
jgi:quinol-cytochrome oxidoreductase complex cytochrome b subunit